MKVSISDEVKRILPSFDVIAYTMDVDNNKTEKVKNYFDEVIKDLMNSYQISDVVNIPKLKVSRDGYKKLGIDPSRYRLACESLVRRIVKGFDVYRINDIVDLGNILSIKTHRSVCVVDLDKVVGNIIIEKGHKEDIYEGINRGLINITNMPAYKDEISYFGTPTSDTMRTAVSHKTKIILVIISPPRPITSFIFSGLILDKNSISSAYMFPIPVIIL